MFFPIQIHMTLNPDSQMQNLFFAFYMREQNPSAFTNLNVI